MIYRILAGIAAFSYVMFIAWAGGFNFTRGPDTAFLMCVAPIVAVLAATFPNDMF